MRRVRNKPCGFTLLEALVSAMLLAIAAVTLNGISTQCLSQIQRNQKQEIAWQMMDRQMTLIRSMGIDAFINQGIMEGEIELPAEVSGNTSYFWRASTEREAIDYLYRLTLVIIWEESGKPRTITADTFMNGSGEILMSR